MIGPSQHIDAGRERETDPPLIRRLGAGLTDKGRQGWTERVRNEV